MERFRTTINEGVSENTLNLRTPILTVGSCFSEAIGRRLEQSKFPTLTNPLGTLYNPLAITRGLGYILSGQVPPAHTFLNNQDVFLNYDFHSSFSSPDRHVLAEKIQKTLREAREFLKTAQWLLITLGTAWTHTRTDTHEAVANCHKMPAKHFSKSLLSEQQICAAFADLHTNLKTVNPAIRIVLTVSPVRHIKETLEGNSVSKAVLRVACHRLAREFGNVSYFPAYEIMMDDLRDYRFYKNDMIHPTDLAEEYIWEKFTAHYADEPTRDFITTWRTLRAALTHKPFHPASAAHQNFLRQTLKKLEELKNTVDVDTEIRALQAQLY